MHQHAPILSVASFRAWLGPDGWRSQVLHGADELSLPEFGLTCPVKDVYRDTPLG